MKHFTQNLKWLLMSCLLFVGVGSAWADEETIDFSAQGYSNTQQVSETSGTKVKATFTNGSTPTAYYNTGTGVRIYGGGSVTITANGYTISKIVYTFSGGTNYAPGSTATWDPSTGTATVGATTTWEGSATSVKLSRPTGSGHWRLQKVTVTYTTGSSSDPSISADNVDIAYNATSGQIAYTVNNPATGGSMSAATSSSWVTLGSNYASPIAFTCGTNTGASERTATVTLTYTYGSNTATKDVTITQAGNPNVVNNISDITDAGTYTVKGTIVAKSTRGFIVGDGTGFVYYYNQNYDQSAYNIGDKVKLSGSVIAYGGVFEFNNSAEITAATESNYVEGSPTILTGADMDSRVASTTPTQLSTYVQYVGTLSVNGTYYNITSIDGATTAQGSISFPLNTDFTSLNGATVTVKGYFVGVSSSKYYNTLIGSIEALSGFVAAPTFSVPEGEYSEAKTVEINCATSGATIYYTTDGSDPTTSSTVYSEPLTFNTTTTLKAIASDGTNVSEITSATYTIDARIETHIVLNNGTDYPSGQVFTITVGDAFTSPEAWVTLPTGVYLNRANSNLTCTGDNPDLASVNSSTGAVTLVSGATGTVNVTISYPGSENYKPCTGSYSVTVNPASVTPTGDYVKVTSDSDLTDGEYLIVYEDGSLAFDGGLETLDAVGNTISVTINNNTIASSTTIDAATFTIDTANGTILSASGKYIGQTSDANGLKAQDTALENTISINSDGNADIVSGGAYLRYNSASNQTRFRYYKSSSYTGQKAIALYKKNAAPDTRTATTVTLDPATASYNVVLGETFTAPTAALDPAAAGTLTYTSSDENVATVAADGSVTILAAGTTTITAKFEGNTEYKPSQASYTITVTAPAAVYTTIQQLQEAATNTSADITFQMTNIYVTAVKNNQAWISDGTYGAVIYSSGHGLTAGQKLNGTITGKLVLYNGATEITNFDGSALTTTTETLAAQTKTIGDITVANQSLPVKLESVTYNATDKTFSDGTNTIAYYDQFSVSPTLEDGHVYDITGIITYHNNLQIAPLAATDVVEVSAAVETTTTIDASGITNTDVNAGTAAGSLSATVALASDGSPISGATVTWESSVPSVATIDPTTGDVTLVAAGTTTITATYAGVSGQYQSSSATYELTVTDTTTPSAGGDYVKVTSDSDLEDGEYLIVYEAGSLAFDGSLETLDASQNTIAVTIATDNTIASSATVDAATFTIATTTNGYSIKSASGKFIGQTTDVNGMKEQDTALDNTISIDTDGNAVILASGGAYLRYNKNSGQERFRYFKSSTYTAQQPVALYKKNTAPDTRIATTVTLDPATASYDVVLGDAFTAPTATLDPAAAGTLTYTSSNEDVATVAADGTVTILAAGTTTITAKFEGSNDYKPSQASYTIVVTAPATVYTSLQQLQENVTSTSQDFTLQPATDIYVTAVKGTNNAYLSDGTYGALVYTNNHGLTVGQKFTGTLAAKFVLYKGATEITNFDATGLTITDGTLAPQTKTIGEITVANQSLPVTFENVTYDAANTAFTDGTNSIKYYNNFNLDPAPVLVDGHVYDITGIIVMYNNLQIAPLAADDVVDKTAPVAVEAPVFDPAGGTYTADQNVTITCATAGATIYYTLDGTDPTTASEEYTGPITITATTTLKAIASDGTNTSTITEATYTINKADVPTPKGIDSNYFVMVKWLDQLETGDKVLIASNEAHKAMYKQNNNNRGAFDFPYTPYQYGNFARLTADDLNYLEQFIVVREGNDFYFYATSEAYKGYIYAASSSGNQLKTKDTRDNNAKASISIDSDTGDATIQFQGTNSHNTMRYNPNNGNPIFNCYLSTSTTGSLPQIYVEVNDPTIAGTPDMVSMVVDAPDGSSWMTWVAPYDMSLPMTDNGGLEAYIVTLNAAQDDATFVRVYNVPANTPIILHAPTGGDYVLDLAPAGTVMDDVSANVLQICDGYNAVGDFDEDAKTGTVYVLWFLDTDNNADTDDVLGFYPLEAGVVLEAGKAFIKLDGSTPAKFFGVNFGDATGINDIAGDALRLDGTIYNMAGQRVSNPTRGIYIVNGKKVLVK